MKTAIFSVLFLSVLAFSCSTDYYDDYASIPHSYNGERIHLSGTVIGIDSLQPMDSALIQIVFTDYPMDTLFCYSDSSGAFSYRYYYRNCNTFEVMCSANDTLHAVLDTTFILSGRDVSAHSFSWQMVLDTL